MNDRHESGSRREEPVGAQPAESYHRRESPVHSNASVHYHVPPPRYEQELAMQRERRFDKLRKNGAEEFSGTTDPMEAERWLKRLGRVFNMMQCTPEEKFDYAVFLLQGDAYDWWETVPNSMVQPPVLTWDDFVRIFQNYYLPAVYLDDKRDEFLRLEQGEMTVAEYEVRFNQLSVYALTFITTEREKCRRFEKGLRYGIRKKITASDLETFVKLKAAAIRAEKFEREKITLRMKRGFSESEVESKGKRARHVMDTSSAQTNVRDRTFIDRDDRSSTFLHSEQSQRLSSGLRSSCPECGMKHVGECRKLTGGCYHCGSLEHIRRDCPKRRPSERENSQTTVQNDRVGRGRGSGVFTTEEARRSEVRSFRPVSPGRIFSVARPEADDMYERGSGFPVAEAFPEARTSR